MKKDKKKKFETRYFVKKDKYLFQYKSNSVRVHSFMTFLGQETSECDQFGESNQESSGNDRGEREEEQRVSVLFGSTSRKRNVLSEV